MAAQARHPLTEQLVTSLLENYAPTPAQVKAEQDLRKQGFRFSNWVAAHPDAEGEPVGDSKLGTMVLTKRTKGGHRTEYREIEPDGSVN